MVKTYWSVFYLSLVGCLLFLGFLILGFVFMRRLFLTRIYGLIKLVAVTLVFLTMLVLSGLHFVRCCKDYHYIANDSFEEEKAKLVEFVYSKKDYDGNGQIINAKPKFLLIDRNEYIVLHAKDIDIGKTYLIRYYPNTKICEVLYEIQGQGEGLREPF